MVVVPEEGERLALSLCVFAQAQALVAVVQLAPPDQVFERLHN